MANEFIHIISLILALGGIGVDANPKAPNTDVVLAHAPADADYVVHLDLQSFLPRNYKVFTSLPTAPSVAKDPQAKAMVEQMVRESEMALGMISGMTGFNPIDDLHSVTAWLQLPASGDPNFLVVFRGKFAGDILDKVAATTGMPTNKIDGRSVITFPDNKTVVGMTAKGDLLVGNAAWVEKRLAAAWKPEVSPKDAKGRSLAPLFAKRPFMALASAPSPTAVARLTAEMGGSNDPAERTALEVFTRHSFAGVAVTNDSLGWTYGALDSAGLDRASAISSAALDLMRASHLLARGMVTLMFEGLESQRGSSPEIDAILAHKDALRALVIGFLGDGSFKTKVDKNAKTKTLTVWASGKKISDVVPVIGVLPIVGALAFIGSRDDKAEAAAAVAVKAPRQIKPEPAAEPRKVDPRSLFMELTLGY